MYASSSRLANDTRSDHAGAANPSPGRQIMNFSLADKGVDSAIKEDSALAEGLNTRSGKITHPALEDIPHDPA